MKKTILVALALAASFGLPSAPVAFAADDCIIHYNRTACPGKEEESYSKCGGSKECDKADAASTEAACTAAAKEACANSRLDITKSKRITARFNGKVRDPTQRGHRFRSIADTVPMIADSW